MTNPERLTGIGSVRLVFRFLSLALVLVNTRKHSRFLVVQGVGVVVVGGVGSVQTFQTLLLLLHEVGVGPGAGGGDPGQPAVGPRLVPGRDGRRRRRRAGG